MAMVCVVPALATAAKCCHEPAAVNDGTEIELRSDASRTRPGLKGNLIVNIVPGQALAAAAKKNKKKQGNRQRPAVGALPAIPFEIVQP